MERALMGIVFADVEGFGGLSEGEVARFAENVLPEAVGLARNRKAAHVNTWGDAIVGFFHDVGGALDFAFDLRDLFKFRDWMQRAGNGYRYDLKVRVALHAADVFVGDSDAVPGGRLFGTQVSFAARIEPVAVPNEVFASEAAVGILRAQGLRKFVFDDLGLITLPKERRRERIFRVRRVGEADSLPGGIGIAGKVRVLDNTETALAEIRASTEDVGKVDVQTLNGGSSLHSLLEAVSRGLVEGARIRVLVFDPECSRLEVAPLVDGSGRAYLDRLRGLVEERPEIAVAACEYLFQASELTAWTTESQESQLARLRERVSNFLQMAAPPSTIVRVLKSPRWVPVRTWLLDDRAYLTLYLQPYKLGPVLVAERGSGLFEAVRSHFNYVWSDVLERKHSLIFSGAASNERSK